MAAVSKIEVPEIYWDNVFAPSSCLVIITTIDRQGRPNAASFGTCTRVNHGPVDIAFTCTVGKDTTTNVLETGEFVVNVVPFEKEMLDRTLTCGLPFATGVNEIEKAGLTALPSLKLKPPRIAECRVHFECSLLWSKEWRDRVMFCGNVQAVTIDEDCIDPQGFLVWDRAKPAHFCGGHYQDRFVPAYNAPLRAHWSHDGPDDEFRPGVDWRNMFKSAD